MSAPANTTSPIVAVNGTTTSAPWAYVRDAGLACAAVAPAWITGSLLLASGYAPGVDLVGASLLGVAGIAAGGTFVALRLHRRRSGQATTAIERVPTAMSVVASKDAAAATQSADPAREVTTDSREAMCALQVAMRALLNASALADALPKILQAVRTTLTWEHARLWRADGADGPLRPSNQWRAPSSDAAPASAGGSSALAASALAEGDVRWETVQPHETAASPTPQARFVVPLRLGRQTRGVLEILGQTHVVATDQIAAMLAILAAAVGQFLERKETEKRLFEAESAISGAARAKSDFLALMSHEIRTPMNGVIGMSNLLLETQLTPKQRDFAQTIRSSGDSLLTVINDILDFSKIEAGKLAIEKVDFDLRSAVDETLELMAGNAHAKHLELAAHVHADVPSIVHGDPNRLRQILNNLVANAIKFTAHGEVIITVAREAITDQRLMLRFAVRDSGIGIPSEVQKRLFQPFMQADTSTTRRYGGTGLGLAISRTLVEMMHGRIGVVSEEGKGATFHFTIRFDRPKESHFEPPARAVALHGARALIVEDNASHATILAQQLKGWGLRPTRANSIEAALHHLAESSEREPFSLVVIDGELHNAAGASTLDHDALQKLGAGPRIVLLTGIGQQLRDDELRALGVAAWVTKPVRESRLHEAVTAVLHGGTSPQPPGSRARSLVVSSPVMAAPVAAGPVRILLVEDNIINQQVALQLLARMGFAADVALDGVEALAALRRAPYEIVLMDCMMPHMDGYETTRRIREIERRRAALGIARPEVHIIALTANTSTEDRARCLAAGMNEFVTKPLRPDDLERLLEQWRKRSDAMRSSERSSAMLVMRAG